MKIKNALILALSLGLVLPTAHAAEEEGVMTTQLYDPANPVPEIEDPETARITAAPAEETEAVLISTPDETSLPVSENDDIDSVIDDINQGIGEINEVLNENEKNIVDREEPVPPQPIGRREWYYSEHNKTYNFNGKSTKIHTVVGELLPGPGKDYELVRIDDLQKTLKGSDFNFDVVRYFTETEYYGEENQYSDDIDYVEIMDKAGKTHKFIVHNYKNQKYLDIFDFGKTLGYRTRYNFNDLLRGEYANTAIDLDTSKSDVHIPTVDEINKEIKKKDYTLIYSYSPIQPNSLMFNSNGGRTELSYMEELAQYILEQRKYNIQMLGFVDYADLYTHGEMNQIYDKNKALWKIYGTDEAVDKHLAKLYSGNEDDWFIDNIFIVDKNGKIVGRGLHEIRQDLYNLYFASNKAPYDDKRQLTDKEMEDLNKRIEKINDATYALFLDYAIGGKKIEVSDVGSNKLRPVTIKNEDKPKQVGEEIGSTTNPPTIRPRVDKVKVPAKAQKSSKSTNPQTGVGSLTGLLGLAGAASLLLKKTKKH